MLIGSFILLAVAMVAYRVLVFTIPFFHAPLAQEPLANIACGVASDLVVISGFGLLWLLCAQLPGNGRARRYAAFAGWLIAFVCVAGFACHLRYVEHFGMTLRPFHIGAAIVDDMWMVGTHMVVQSDRAKAYVIGSLLLSGALVWWTKPLERRLPEWTLKTRMLVSGGLLLSLIAANAAMINMRILPGMHSELRYNPLTALYYSYRERQKYDAIPVPTLVERRELRTMLSADRSYALGEEYDHYPLWQTKVPVGVARREHDAVVRDELRSFLEDGAVKRGPWNIIFVLAESLRAHELSAFGNRERRYESLTPNISRMAAEGITFSETIAAGLSTHYGIVASQCSLYGNKGSILVIAPLANAVCLPDVFRQRGYETYFFYGADNHFDNQDIFFVHHQTDFIFDENRIAQGERGGWGYSDAALFDFSLRTLRKARQPFYANILTLTNHSPYKLPEDMPVNLRHPSIPLADQMINYVDWTLGKLYRAIERDMPHTILIVLADHGHFSYVNASPGVNPYETHRQVSRVPWLLVIPNLPEQLKGKKIDHLVSQVDVGPTLLSLLGWHNIPQSFMGEDAFSRSGPVYTDWLNALIRFEETASGIRIKLAGKQYEDLIGAASRYNFFAPPRKLWRQGKSD